MVYGIWVTYAVVDLVQQCTWLWTSAVKEFTVYPVSVCAAETAGTSAADDTFANTCNQHN